MQGLIQANRIRCSSCALKIIIRIYNGLCWQEGNIGMLLQLQAPGLLKDHIPADGKLATF